MASKLQHQFYEKARAQIKTGASRRDLGPVPTALELTGDVSQIPIPAPLPCERFFDLERGLRFRSSGSYLPIYNFDVQ